MPSAQHLISFHLVTAGGCWAIPEHSEPVRLGVGDVVVFPGGIPHIICSDLKAPRSAAFDVQNPAAHRAVALSHWRREATGRVRLGLICGFLGCDVRPFNPLIAALPRTMVVSDRSGARRLARPVHAVRGRRGGRKSRGERGRARTVERVDVCGGRARASRIRFRANRPGGLPGCATAMSAARSR